MQSSPVLRSESYNGAETGSQYYFTWFVVFFCHSDKVGLRLVSLQQAHALSMTLPERGRGEAERKDTTKTSGMDGQHQAETKQNVWQGRGANELWIWVNLGQIVPTGRRFLWIIHSAGGLIIYPPSASPCSSDSPPPHTFTIHWPL